MPTRLDNYLFGPWQEPEHHFYPVLDHLLDDWSAQNAHRSRFEGIRIIGFRWSAQSHTLKNFLARNLIPYEWLETDRDREAEHLLRRAGLDSRQFPVVFFPDGSWLVQPSLDQLADKVGLQKQADHRFYDLVVVGGGPAGLSAAVYGASEGLNTLLLESDAPGGQAGASARIDNYLGFPSGLSGNELTRRAVAKARRFGVEILTPQKATGVRIQGRYRLVQLQDGLEVACHALLIAAGVSYRYLDVPGMAELSGAGVFYGAVITEAISCQGKEVFVLGGGNSAGQAALYLSRFASQISIVTIEDSLQVSMSRYLIDQIKEAGNIQVHTNATVTGVHGQDHLERLTLQNQKTGKSETVPAVALFIYIGATPRTDWLGDLLVRDEQGYLLTGPDLEGYEKEMVRWTLTRKPYFLEGSVPGIFVAGDIRHGSVKRIASAVGEGAMAVTFIHQYLTA